MKKQDLENQLRKFYSKVNFYKFDSLVSYEVKVLDNIKFLSAKVRTHRDGEYFVEKIFEPLHKFI